MRPAVFLGVNLAAAGALLAWLVWHHGRPAFLRLASSVDGLVVLAAAVSAAATLGCLTARWRLLLAILGTPVRTLRALAYRAAGQAVGTVVPSARLGGDPLRVWLLVRGSTPPAAALASVAIDRGLEMGSSAGFTVFFALILLRQGIPALHGPVASALLGALAIATGLGMTMRRLRRHAGLLTALVQRTGLGRLRLVRGRLALLEEAEAAATALVARTRPLAHGFLLGVLANLLTPLEYWLLLTAFGLPADGVAVVAAIFATGAAHSMPVPGGVGVLEGAQMWLFGMLGHPAEVGLAVGFAVRLREIAWVVPGLVVLAVELLRSDGTRSRRTATDS